jgi:hypothetical protein
MMKVAMTTRCDLVGGLDCFYLGGYATLSVPQAWRPMVTWPSLSDRQAVTPRVFSVDIGLALGAYLVYWRA